MGKTRLKMGSLGINTLYVIVETIKVERIQSNRSSVTYGIRNINISSGGLRERPHKKKNKVSQQAKSGNIKLEIHKTQGSRIFVEESCYECQMLNKGQ